MRLVSYAVALFCWFTVIHNSWGADEASSCGGMTQLEMNICAGESYRKADEELNNLYKQLMTQLDSKRAKKRLKESQQAWLIFRDKTCLFEVGAYDDEGSGSMWSQLDNMCMEYHTRKRIEDIRKYVGCTGASCPGQQ